MESVTSAPAAARVLAWVDAEVPGANVTMYPLDATGAGVGVGDGVGEGVGLGSGVGAGEGVESGGATLGSALGAADGATLGSALGGADGATLGSALGAAEGSALGSALGAADGAALGAGLPDGSAAWTGTGAKRAPTRRKTCMNTRNRIARSRGLDRLGTRVPRSLCQPLDPLGGFRKTHIRRPGRRVTAYVRDPGCGQENRSEK
jgi:hypothetical protein